MEYRYMGRTGLQLSVLSFGSWVTFHKQIEDHKADELMGMAYDAGINFFDNAEAYAGGESELMMGRVLKNKQWDRTTYVLVVKSIFSDCREKITNPTSTDWVENILWKPAMLPLDECRRIISICISAIVPIPTCPLKK